MPSRTGSRNGVPGLTFWAGHWAFFARFVAMLYLVELYDIVFFAHFYPELKGIGGPTSSATTKRSTPCILPSTCLSASCWPGSARCFETALFVGQKCGKTSSAY